MWPWFLTPCHMWPWLTGAKVSPAPCHKRGRAREGETTEKRGVGRILGTSRQRLSLCLPHLLQRQHRSGFHKTGEARKLERAAAVLHLWMLRGGGFDDLRPTEVLVMAVLVAAPCLTVNHGSIYRELSGGVQLRGFCGARVSEGSGGKVFYGLLD